MARPWRIEYEGAFYHVMSRGNERRPIFLDDEDRSTFLSFDPVEFLARLSVHVPNAREQTVRYMGFYSNKSRGMRKRAGLSEVEIKIMEEQAKESRSRNYAWAWLNEVPCGELQRITSLLSPFFRPTTEISGTVLSCPLY